MNEEQLVETAETLAWELVQQNVDPNEVASALETLRDLRNGRQFFRFLETVVDDGEAVVRSKRTIGYYRRMLEVCRKHLTPYQDDPERMANVLGWAARLMRYYAIEDELDRSGLRRKRAKLKGKSEPLPEGRHRGRVKFFNARRGFGFVTPEAGGGDVFVHVSQLSGGLSSLNDGDRVTYAIGPGRKGPEAKDVRPA